MKHIEGELLDDFLSGELDAERRLEVSTHLESCNECRSLVLKWQKWRDTLQELAEPEPSESFVKGVMSRVAPEQSSPSSYSIFDSVREWALQAVAVTFSLMLMWVSSPASFENGTKETVMTALYGDVGMYEYSDDEFSLPRILGVEEGGL